MIPFLLLNIISFSFLAVVSSQEGTSIILNGGFENNGTAIAPWVCTKNGVVDASCCGVDLVGPGIKDHFASSGSGYAYIFESCTLSQNTSTLPKGQYQLSLSAYCWDCADDPVPNGMVVKLGQETLTGAVPKGSVDSGPYTPFAHSFISGENDVLSFTWNAVGGLRLDDVKLVMVAAPQSEGGSNAGAIAGGIVGALSALLIGGIAWWYLRRRRRTLTEEEGEGAVRGRGMSYVTQTGSVFVEKDGVASVSNRVVIPAPASGVNSLLPQSTTYAISYPPSTSYDARNASYGHSPPSTAATSSKEAYWDRQLPETQEPDNIQETIHRRESIIYPQTRDRDSTSYPQDSINRSRESIAARPIDVTSYDGEHRRKVSLDIVHHGNRMSASVPRLPELSITSEAERGTNRGSLAQIEQLYGEPQGQHEGHNSLSLSRPDEYEPFERRIL
ncbi:hypothetical protein BT69DRAFT_1321166 [Atractiella rhizophila]|nr:hypothetical protein BT69DRAFT_1321166 [Atractiella rhizophila]